MKKGVSVQLHINITLKKKTQSKLDSLTKEVPSTLRTDTQERRAQRLIKQCQTVSLPFITFLFPSVLHHNSYRTVLVVDDILYVYNVIIFYVKNSTGIKIKKNNSEEQGQSTMNNAM